jgi:hypothetical protein
VYFSVGDVRIYGWYDKVLFRVAAHDKDYKGGRNNFTCLDYFHSSIQTLFNSKAS